MVRCDIVVIQLCMRELHVASPDFEFMLYCCQIIAGSSMLFLQNLESKFAGRVVVEVARSAARDH